MSGYEVIHTICEYHDGPRSGIANYNGAPHVYQCHFDEALDEWSDCYSLMPIDPETFQLALEDHALWERLADANRAKRITDKEFMAFRAAGPCLPEDLPRCTEIRRLLGNKLEIDPTRRQIVVG